MGRRPKNLTPTGNERVDARPWEKRGTESQLAYTAFVRYRDTGRDAPWKEVYAKCKAEEAKKPESDRIPLGSRWQTWFDANDWSARRQAYYSHLDELDMKAIALRQETRVFNLAVERESWLVESTELAHLFLKRIKELMALPLTYTSLSIADVRELAGLVLEVKAAVSEPLGLSQPAGGPQVSITNVVGGGFRLENPSHLSADELAQRLYDDAVTRATGDLWSALVVQSNPQPELIVPALAEGNGTGDEHE